MTQSKDQIMIDSIISQLDNSYWEIIGEINDWEVRFDYHIETIRWWLKLNKEQYEKVESYIDNMNFEDDNFAITFSYDVSWYNYRVVQQEEDNYIHATMNLKKKLWDNINYQYYINTIDQMIWEFEKYLSI